MPQPQGEPLIRRAAAGDPDAMAELWLRNRSWVAAVVLARAPAWADPEDLLQEVATTMVQRLGELRDPRRLRPWLRTVAVHHAAQAGRRRRRLRRLEEPGEVAARSSEVERRVDSEAREHQAQRALRAARDLPEDYREPLLLQCVRGLRQKDIAMLLGLPLSTVESRIARARRLLRSALSDREDPQLTAPRARRSASS